MQLPFKRSDDSAARDGVAVFDPATKRAAVSVGGAFLGMAQIVAAPASAGASGEPGQIAYDGSYLYVCTATDTWRRIAHATW